MRSQTLSPLFFLAQLHTPAGACVYTPGRICIPAGAHRTHAYWFAANLDSPAVSCYAAVPACSAVTALLNEDDDLMLMHLTRLWEDPNLLALPVQELGGSWPGTPWEPEELDRLTFAPLMFAWLQKRSWTRRSCCLRRTFRTSTPLSTQPACCNSASSTQKGAPPPTLPDTCLLLPPRPRLPYTARQSGTARSYDSGMRCNPNVFRSIRLLMRAFLSASNRLQHSHLSFCGLAVIVAAGCRVDR